MKKTSLWIALSLANRIGSKTLKALLAHFDDDAAAILRASSAELQQVPGIGPKIAYSIQSIDLEQIELALEFWTDEGVSSSPAAIRAAATRRA